MNKDYARVTSIALKAGEIALNHFRGLSTLDVEAKGPLDLVTIADREIERFICDALARVFPEDGVFGEEGSAVVGRSAGEVAILAAVKTRPPEQVVEVLAAGARVLGHNRAQELAAVEPRVRELWPGGHETQEGMSRSERVANQAAAFAVNPRHGARMAGRAVLLVDESEWDRSPGAHEAIVDPATFGLVRKLARRDMRLSTGAKRSLPLSGVPFLRGLRRDDGAACEPPLQRQALLLLLRDP